MTTNQPNVRARSDTQRSLNHTCYDSPMAYEIEVVAPVTPSKDVDYINECCRGGDVLRDRLLPKIRAAYPRLITCQEDFGWIIWARDGKTVLATDIFADDPDKGEFRIHLSSRVKRWV